MKDFITKHIRGQAGVSLVQTLVGAAIVGGLSLVAAKLSTQDTGNRLIADANYGVIDLTGRIQSLVSNKDHCQTSFAPLALAVDQSSQVASLKLFGGADAFVTNNLYSDKKVKINRMSFRRTSGSSVLTVEMEKIVPGKPSAGNFVRKEFFINAKYHASSNQLETCASDITNFKETVLNEAIARACPTTGVAEGLVRDPADNMRCKALYQMKENNALLACPAEQTIVGLIWNPTSRTYLPQCRPIMGTTATIPCAKDQLLKRDTTTGDLTCVTIKCNPGEVAMGLDPATGLMKCKSCPAGSYLISTPTGWECKTAMCPGDKTASQKYFMGFTGNGDPVCQPLLGSATSCPGGGSLQVSADGAVEFGCCNATCSGNDQRCIGTVFASDNGCGSCQGTKPADCSNADQYCTGTTNVSFNGCGTCPGTKPADCSNNALHCSGQVYTSPNGCGTCTGSRGPQNATWSAFTATSEYREKLGSACSVSCGTGSQGAQRKYVRTCSDDQACGGTPCSGSAEEWRDEGTIACTMSACSSCTNGDVRIMTSTQTNSSNTTYCGSADGHTGDIWTYGYEQCVSGNWNRVSGGLAFRRSQDICNSKTVPPSGTDLIYKSNGVDPCNVAGEKAQMQVTSSYGTFDFCTWRFISGGGGSSGGGGGGCFVAGTQITMHDGSTKNIEDILVGDKLLDGQNKVVTVQKLIPLPYSGEIFAINGGGYFFTPNHPFLTVDGWKSLDPIASMKETPDLKVSKMKVGDILIKRNGMELVISLDSIPTNEKVYNFELDGSHEYVADEYVVHNKVMAPQDPPVEAIP